MSSTRKKFLSILAIFSLLFTLLIGCTGEPPAPATSNNNPEQNRQQKESKETETKQEAPKQEETKQTTQEVGVTKDIITLGAWTPLTGPAASLRTLTMAAEAYTRYINDQGGIHGRTFDFKLYDDQFQPSKTVGVAKRLVENDQVFAVIAPMGTGPNIAAHPYMEENGVPMINIASAAEYFINPTREQTFVGAFTGRDEGKLYGWYVTREMGARRPAIIYQDDDFGKAILNNTVKMLEALGVKPSASIPFNLTDVDFSPYAAKLRQANPDVVIVVSYADNTAKILKAADQIGFKPKWFINYSANDPIMFDLLGNLWNGVITANFVKPLDSPDPAVREYMEQFKKYYPNEEPTTYGLQGWTYAKIFVEALDRVGPDVTREKLIETLESMKGYETGITGPVSYGPDDHVSFSSLFFSKVENGEVKALTEFIDVEDVLKQEGIKDLD